MTSLYSRIKPHFTQDLLSPGLKIGYHDEGGVWQFVAPSLALRLPLRAIEWRNLVGVTKTIDRLPVNFVAAPESEPVMPLACIYVIKCEDLDRYKSTVRAQIAHWIDKMNAAKVDWMLLYVPLGTRTKAGSGAGSSSSNSNSSGGRHGGHSVYKKIFDKIKNDFGNKKSASSSASLNSSGGGTGAAPGSSSSTASDSARSPAGVAASAMSNFSNSLAGIGSAGSSNGVSVDRICKIDTLEGASVVGTQSTHELQWTELLLRLRKCMMEAFEYKCLQYEEEVRLMDAKRSLPSWDFGAFFVAKERLALMYQQTYLLDDAIRHLDELEAIFSFLAQSDKRFQSSSLITSDDPIFHTAPLAIDLSGLHRRIASNQAPPLLMRLYFFSRQIRTLYLMGDFCQLIQRSITFISSFHESLTAAYDRHPDGMKWFHPHLWAVGACFEIAYACELSWSGHDYQISTTSIPEGVFFALTPEVMAGLLGDILYLARRTLKKSTRRNGWWNALAATEDASAVASSTSSTASIDEAHASDWFKSLQAVFEASTPDSFQRCVWEVSHLASLHFSRAGRHRMAVFLGGECARYHFHHREFESASRLFRSHARQCEEDKWWTLVSDRVKRICDSELALGRSAQAVAACFSMLEIAQASKAELSHSYLEQLLSSLVQSLDQSARGEPGESSSPTSSNSAKMGELIKPSITIETMQSPESDLDYGDVRVTLSLTNQFPAGIHIESVRIRFTKCEDNTTLANSTEDALIDVNLDAGVDMIEGESESAVSVLDGESSGSSLVELAESNVYLYERASVNLIFLYGDVDVGVYSCSGLECSVAGNTFPLFSRTDSAAIRFEIPPRKSTLRVHIEGPPLLIPASMEEIRVIIESEDDAVHHGVLEIALPDGCDAVALSQAGMQPLASPPPVQDGQQSQRKCLVQVSDLKPHSRSTCSVWLIMGDVLTSEQDDHVVAPVAASLRYDVAGKEGRRHTELRRCEHTFRVRQPLAHSTTLKRIGDRLFVAVTLHCCADVGVRMRNYELVGDPNDEKTAPVSWCVTQDLNEHVLGLRLRPGESVHLVFGVQIDTSVPLSDYTLLRVGIEYEGHGGADDKSSCLWRADCLLDIPFASVNGAAYHIDVQPKPPSHMAHGCPMGEDVVFTIHVQELGDKEANPLEIRPVLLLSLDEASESEWILLGKQCEAIDFGVQQDHNNSFKTTKRLLPLRAGRLRFPRFRLRVDPAHGSPSSISARHIDAARVFCAQEAQSLLVV